MESYIKEGLVVLTSSSNLFVYETCVYAYYKNFSWLAKKEYYTSNKEIDGVVDSFYISKNIQICSELYAAPLKWLTDNKFIKYEKTKKIKITKSKTKDNGK